MFIPGWCQYVDVVCTLCQHKTKVTNSRPFRAGAEVWRRRECLSCRHVFTTYERYNYRDITVLKRSGAQEELNTDKILLSIAYAAKSPSEAIELAKTVIEKLAISNQTIKSTDIAHVVINTLANYSKAAHARYNSYQLEK